MKNKEILLVVLLLFCSGGVEAQELSLASQSMIDMPKMSVRRSGPYFGLQQGTFNLFELGGEMQYKKVKLVRPDVHGFRIGFNYDYKNRVMGYEAGYWYQQSRVGLTYGALLSYRTDFTHGRLGIAPVLGFRLTQFHLQTGYHFLTPDPVFVNCNTFFIALKFVLINKRKRDFDKG